MTVCTDDLAARNLAEHALPVAVSERLPDTEGLGSNVVELEYDWVRLAAIDAGMRLEKLD